MSGYFIARGQDIGYHVVLDHMAGWIEQRGELRDPRFAELDERILPEPKPAMLPGGHKCARCHAVTLYGVSKVCHECRPKRRRTPLDAQREAERQARLGDPVCPECGAQTKRRGDRCTKCSAERQKRKRREAAARWHLAHKERLAAIRARATAGGVV